VCALPFPVLRTLQVSPPFTAAKRSVVDTLRTTSVCRVFLQVSARVWDAVNAAVVTDLPLMLVADATPGQPGPRAVLEAFVTGPQARRMAAMEAGARTRLVTALAERLHPRLRGAVERTHCYAWDHDRWARGDYAWFAPGELRAFRAPLAAPEGAIHFAGDHTSALPGWMEGALGSGLRAASEVHAALSHAGV
jgi:monoamine oxidase